MLKYIFIVAMGFSSLNAYAAKVKMGFLSLEPYYSMIQNKDNFTDSSGQDVSKVRKTEEYGLRASLKLASILQLRASYGESKSKKTEKAIEIADTFDQIDFQTDLQIDTTDPDVDVTVNEHQKNAKLKLVIDPSFSIFIVRVYVGVSARWRLLTREDVGVEDYTAEYGPEYNPVAGAGFGIKLSRRLYAMAEYEFYFYNYPTEFEPFEQALSVSVGVSI